MRKPLGVSAFGANVVVYPPRMEGFFHYHDTQDELYFVHRGTARVEVDGEVRELGPGGFVVLPARMAHFAWTKDETIIQINSEGPFQVNYVNPADDPRGPKK